MEETGLLQGLLQKCKSFVPVAGYQSDYSSVGREHIESALLLFSGGALGSLVFLLAELIYAFCKQFRNGRK